MRALLSEAPHQNLRAERTPTLRTAAVILLDASVLNIPRATQLVRV